MPNLKPPAPLLAGDGTDLRNSVDRLASRWGRYPGYCRQLQLETRADTGQHGLRSPGREATLAGVWLPGVGALLISQVESSPGGRAQGGAGEAGPRGTPRLPLEPGGRGCLASGCRGQRPGPVPCSMDRGAEGGSALTDPGSGSSRRGRHRRRGEGGGIGERPGRSGGGAGRGARVLGVSLGVGVL